MRLLAIAALLFASVAHARGAIVPSLTALVAAQTEEDVAADEGSASEEEAMEEVADEAAFDEATSDEAASEEAAAEEMLPESAAAAAPSATTSSAANPKAQELVSGAPLYNPNVAVHIVQKKQFKDMGKHEVTLYPALAQLNGKFTQHFGTALGYTYHLHENFGLQFTPLFNWSSQQSGFNAELIEKAQLTAEPATSLLLNYGALAGVEVTPIYGKFAWYDSTLGQFSLILTGGAGYGTTRLQLKEANTAGAATFGDAGGRFLGSVGAGFRVQLGERFAIRMEVRDIVYTARVDRVNGCNRDDLSGLRDAFNHKTPLSNVAVSAGCRSSEFEGNLKDGYPRGNDLSLAYSMVENTTSDVLNLVSFFGGVSFLF
jgi:outer membrane beta-barrel protein